MAEETVPVPAETERMEEVPAPSTSAEQADGNDVDNEAKRLMGVGSRNLVMKDIRSAVNAFQEASSLLGKKYGETADQCADAFYYYGMALLELARMENGVLGNALEGIPEDEEEDGEKEEDPTVPSASDLAEKERELLREQVYDAMAEKEDKSGKEPEKNGETEEPKAEGKDEEIADGKEMKDDKSAEEKGANDEKGADGKAEKGADGKAEKGADGKAEKGADGKGAKDKENGASDEKGAEVEAEKVAKEDSDLDMECDKPTEAEESTKTEKAEETPENKAEKETESEASKTEEAKVEAGNMETSNESVGEVKETEVTDDAKGKTEEKEADSTLDAEEKPADKTEAAKDVSEPPTKTDEAAPKEESAEEEQEAEGDEETMEDEEDEGEESEENEGTEEKENEEDDVGNLQLAWEMLDLSKIIYKRQQDKASQLKAAQAHLKLGEVSIESENYSQAVEDFLACLNIQKEHMEEHDRLLAETNYQLGLAYQYSSKHEEAISHFTQSIDVIEKRVAVLTEQLEKATGSPDELQKEMEELKGLLPDIKEKIEDSKEAQKTADLTEKALKETLIAGSSAFTKKNGGTPTSTAAELSADCTVPVTNCVSDISHLVRKKRKPEEESPLKEAKKCKSEPVENGGGTGDAVVPTNEDVEKAEEAETQTPMETAAVESTV
ncbi:nuclear autoantigenic sperm protein [Mixophyes fleayi]|uniref:nuclear autoantigenic sperm protein n=1 Tax=Mixophyes fleayi TaxID=3061075 RepID=UPI003F4E039E